GFPQPPLTNILRLLQPGSASTKAICSLCFPISGAFQRIIWGSYEPPGCGGSGFGDWSRYVDIYAGRPEGVVASPNWLRQYSCQVRLPSDKSGQRVAQE